MLLLLLLAAKPPTWSEVDGPWKKGSYVDVAVDAGGTAHATWVEADTLRYASGPKWKPVTLATGVMTGDGGQIRPEIAVAGERVVVLYTAAGESWLVSPGGKPTSAGKGQLNALGVVDGKAVVALLGEKAHVWLDGKEVYTSGDDGVCVCCRPAVLARPASLAVAFRDADGPRRDVRLIVDGQDRGDVTTGKWSPGGCPADGPALTNDAVLASDGRDGTRRIYKIDASGEHLLPLLNPGWQAVQPRALPDGRVITWVEVTEGKAALVMLEGGTPMPIVAAPQIEPGDPVVVGRELWVPYQGDRAVVLAQR